MAWFSFEFFIFGKFILKINRTLSTRYRHKWVKRLSYRQMGDIFGWVVCLFVFWLSSSPPVFSGNWRKTTTHTCLFLHTFLCLLVWNPDLRTNSVFMTFCFTLREGTSELLHSADGRNGTQFWPMKLMLYEKCKVHILVLFLVVKIIFSLVS